MKILLKFVTKRSHCKALKNCIYTFCMIAAVAIVSMVLMLIVYRDRFRYPYQWKRKIYKPFSEGLKPNPSNIEFYNLSSTIQDKNRFECVKTSTNPSVSVCLYPVQMDGYISHDIKNTGMWEPDITALVLEVLASDPTSAFLDIGSNLGYFSLLAAMSNHLVLSVEPDIDHLQRFQKALEMEELTKRVLPLRNAVADQRVVANVRKSGHNQGDSQIEMETQECQGTCPPRVKSIALNDLTYLMHDLTLMSTNHEDTEHANSNLYDKLKNFRRQRTELLPLEALGLYKNLPSNVVMKVDTQGFEHRIFDNPDFFFDRNLVTHVFMEWGTMARSHPLFNKTGEPPSDKTWGGWVDVGEKDAVKVEVMIRFLLERKLRPYSTTRPTLGEALNPVTWHLWPHDIVWCHDSQVLFMAKMGLRYMIG